MPASWYDESQSGAPNGVASKRDSVIATHLNGNHDSSADVTKGKFVRTVYGSVPLKFAMGWPVIASFDELAGCAQWMGGRIPTMEEAQSLYNYVGDSKSADFEQSLGNTIPAVNGYVGLLNHVGLTLIRKGI